MKQSTENIQKTCAYWNPWDGCWKHSARSSSQWNQ